MTARTDTSRQATVDAWAAKLLSGQVYDLHAASAASTYGYQPPIGREAWAHAVQTIGAMAAHSQVLSHVAAQLLPLNLYGTPAQLEAAVYRKAADAVRAGYEDVLGRTGPEAGRPSSYSRPYTLRELVLLTYWLAEATAKVAACVVGVGWCCSDLAEREGVNVPARLLPSLKLVAR